jgi:hypothetical protein
MVIKREQCVNDFKILLCYNYQPLLKMCYGLGNQLPLRGYQKQWSCGAGKVTFANQAT